MNKENLFLKIITYGPLFFIPIIISAISIILINTYNENFERNLKNIEKELYSIEKKSLESKIVNLSEIVVYHKSVVKKELTSRVQNRVYMAYNIAQRIYEKYKDKKSDEEIKKIIKTSLETLIWNDGESFIWIVDYDGVFNLAPAYLKHLEGYSIINFRDVDGRDIIKEEIAICREIGEGFLWDTFTKPNDKSNKQYKQVAFVKAFGHFNWYLGSGEYLDTAADKTDKKLLDTIRNIDKVNDNYIFLLNTKGDMLINKSAPYLIGKNVFKLDNEPAKVVTHRVIDSLKDKNSTSFYYKWINPISNKMEKKYSYIKKIPNTDWIIGSGFYLSDIDNRVSKQKVDMYNIMHSKSKSIIYIAIIIILLSLLFSYYISKKLKDYFTKYKKSIDITKVQLQNLNTTLETKVEQRTSELKRLKDDYKNLATIDTLTNTNNRYSLMKIFSSEIARSHRYNTPLSIIMVDIDFFKKVNDTYGHKAGDTVLISLANLMKKNLRDIDILGRYGGEEFLIILPNTPLDDSKKFADRLRQEVDGFIFDTVGNITISIGLAELKANENFDELFTRVDNLLYKSKNNGRNRVSY